MGLYSCLASCWACCTCQEASTSDGLYQPVLDANEREAVADLLEYLENVSVA
ncbi:hypothetical protein KEM55_008814 [Ascosphaera atra]|nr:hypothetical protein KEM55_008814 [Ascosphaera atra]